MSELPFPSKHRKLPIHMKSICFTGNTAPGYRLHEQGYYDDVNILDNLVLHSSIDNTFPMMQCANEI